MKQRISLIAVFIFMVNVLFAQITETGKASFYADKFDGRVTASGEIFKQRKLTAAHRTLPFGSVVKVTNLENNKTVTVTINDRGPFVNDRVIDLSKSAAQKLDFIRKGVAKVRIEVISVPNGKAKSKQTYNTPAPKPKTNIYKPQKKYTNTENTISSQAIDYYKVETESITPSGFGIQLASYKEAANLIKRCNDIKQTTRKDVFVQVGDNNGDKVYRIIIGTFATREKANSFNQTIQNKFRGSFVIAF